MGSIDRTVVVCGTVIAPPSLALLSHSSNVRMEEQQRSAEYRISHDILFKWHNRILYFMLCLNRLSNHKNTETIYHKYHESKHNDNMAHLLHPTALNLRSAIMKSLRSGIPPYHLHWNATQLSYVINMSSYSRASASAPCIAEFEFLRVMAAMLTAHPKSQNGALPAGIQNAR